MSKNENSVCQSFSASIAEENSSDLPECDSEFLESQIITNGTKGSIAVSNIGSSDHVSSFDLNSSRTSKRTGRLKQKNKRKRGGTQSTISNSNKRSLSPNDDQSLPIQIDHKLEASSNSL